MLCHDWKDCKTARKKDETLEQDSLQYGPSLRGEIVRRGIKEAPWFGHNIGTEGARELKKENWRITVVERRSPMVTAEKEKVPKSNDPTTKNNNKGMETNKLGELVGGV